MILNKKIKQRLKDALRKQTALFLAFALLFEITYPTQVFALTDGPGQPEVRSFEPVATSDMVDLFSGDFNYNIPLLDVEGYPINIAYHSGITMDQEASWVGLGWNINPGVINRNMRGLPDDFAGELVTKEINMKPNKTWGVGANLGIELFGYETGSSNFSVGIGGSMMFKFNNYNGPSIEQGFNVNISAGKEGTGSLSGSLGITSSSDDGLTIQPSMGFSKKVKSNDVSSTSLGLNIGTAANSRGGLQQLTINASMTKTISGQYTNESEAVQKRSGKAGGASNTMAAVSASFNFGMPTYTPMISTSMKNYAMTGNFTLGGELWGVEGKIGVTGSYSSQKLAQTTITNPAYGYLYSEIGQQNDYALMDFNRQNDGSFTENTACLPVTNYTFDTYAVSGQGAGGSYRPFRSDIGYVFDPAAYTTNDDASLTVEVGLGGYVHVGTNVSVVDVNGQSGKWKSSNTAINKLLYSAKGKDIDFENVYFQEANEKTVESDTAFYAAVGYNSPLSPSVNFSNKYEPLLTGFGPVKRKKRAKRSQVFSFLKKSEYNDFAIEKVSNTYTSAPSHHIAEITNLGADGSRYVYGIAAYNKTQREVTFSIGSEDPGTAGARLTGNGGDEASKGLIGYTPNVDNDKTGNKLGIDNYFSRTTTPAYAHSYLLTAVLSSDYIDADAVRGPSDGDLGDFKRFTYKKIDTYKWRTPFEQNKGSYTEGLKSDLQDDKANYIYGEKELWYLDSVISKNYVAVFHTSQRNDGVGVKDENGGYASGQSESMLKLDSISLYSKADLRVNPTTALPIKRVHFEYTYALCKGITNVTSGVGTTGKLTLKKIYFTYQNSNRSILSPYIFDYHETITAENPNYNLKGYDRWGNYKPNNATTIGVKGTTTDVNNFAQGSTMPAADFPYVEQDTATTNQYASVWSLKEIQLPSGGAIKLTYESDDYAYVQNKQAMQMFKVVNYNNASDAGHAYVDFSSSGGKFYFKLQDGITDINKYIEGITYLYFRFLVKIRTIAGYPHLEYVSGYGEIDRDPTKTNTSGNFGYITLKNVTLKDNGGTSVNPVVKTAIQYGRLYMPKKVWTQDLGDVTAMANQGSLGLQILQALVNSDFTKNIKDAIAGPNESLFATGAGGYSVGREFVANKSWFRLLNPNKRKLGGGLRVKKIEIIDEWGSMTGGSEYETSTYGQEYSYKLDDGTSSGVACYEPQLGGDENPWRMPLFSKVKKLMVPDDEFYQEEPMGEAFFPTPRVGYSMVTVKNLQREGVNRHATGKVVHEFYTTKDFPTIVSRTSVSHKRGKDDPFSLRSLLKIDVRDYMTAAQGFSIELNDMDSKPKSQKVYQEGQTEAISSVEYKYKSEPYLTSKKLANKCTTVEKDGTVSVKTIGEFFDMVADFREDKSTTNSISLGVNIDVIPILGVPATIPGVWPSFARQKTRFRSATSTKVIQRFGILEETIATDLGSVVSTKNLAYDAETGNVLLTQTTTNYNDIVYNFKYPAWWYYESMGPAYQNIDFEMSSVSFSGSGVATIGTTAAYFKEGDELALVGSPNRKGWVSEVTTTSIKVIDRDGMPVSGSYSLKVLRSGGKNTLTTDMAAITTMTNPLSALKSNTYANVLQASAVEFSDKRKVHCDCIISPGSTIPFTTNDYVLGIKGNWRPLKSYTHLTGRTQSNYNNNTNIREDGVFTTYVPYYKWANGDWEINQKDWTYVAEVTEFNPYGEELENKDALGRYSSATFGYNQSMPLTVAANSQYKEQGFDGFEDYSYNPCMDDHFKFQNIVPNNTQSHTGRYSLKVSSGTPKTLTKQIALACVDSSGCQLQINVPTDSTITVSNGTSPFAYDWDIVSGNPTVILTSTGLKHTGSGYKIEVIVKDSEGCKSIKVITK